jgi:hypothetical protein
MLRSWCSVIASPLSRDDTIAAWRNVAYGLEKGLEPTSDQSLGQRTLTLTRQAGGYPENVRWKFGPVVFIGLNVQGSNDNYPYAGVDGETRSAAEIARQRAEEIARKAANIQWLRDGFDYATRVRVRGVMVIWQADPNFNNDQHLADTRSYDAYPAYVDVLRDAHGIDVQVVYDAHHDVVLQVANPGARAVTASVYDRYRSKTAALVVEPGEAESKRWSLERTGGWYDLTVTVDGNARFSARLAGHVENE